MEKLNKKIIEFAEENGLYVMAHYDRDQYSKNIKHADREVAYYAITSEHGVLLGNIQPNCSYEQFLTRIALKAIYEAERLSDLVNEMEEEKYYIELTADALADELKEKENKNEN